MSGELNTRIAQIETECRQADFPEFTQHHALSLGQMLLQLASERQLKIIVGVDLGEQCVFRASLPGTCADHQNWLERKFASIRRFGMSTMQLELLAAENPLFAQERAIDPARFVLAGGAIPLRVKSTLVGAAGVAGLASHEDHKIVLEAISILKQAS